MLFGRRSGPSGGGLIQQAAELVFHLGHPAVQALQDFARLGGNRHAILAMMPGGGAAFDGIIKLLAAGAAGALAWVGGFGGHMSFNLGRLSGGSGGNWRFGNPVLA